MVPSSRWSPSFRVLMLATLIVLISISHLIPPASGARSQPKSSPVSKNEQQQQQRLSGHQQVKEFFAKGVKGVRGSTSSSHTNNWAVLVCASRYWFNYRVRSRPPPLLPSPLLLLTPWCFALNQCPSAAHG